MRLLRYIFLVTVTLIILPILSDAQINLSIFPEKFDLKLMPGQNTSGEIRMFNLSQIALPINIQLKNFSAKDEKGGINFENGGEISFDSSQWIKFEENNFVLKSNESKELKFTIEVPNNAEPGGYYTSALFQTEISQTEVKNSATILPVLGALFLLTIQGGEQKYPSLDRQIELTELRAPSFFENGPIAINFRVKNNDPIHVEISGQLILYDLLGQIKEKIEVESTTILPGKTRFFELKRENNGFLDHSFIGPYKGELILSTKTWQEKIGNDRQLVRIIYFFAFPWKAFVVLIIISLILILLIFISKRKKVINQ